MRIDRIVYGGRYLANLTDASQHRKSIGELFRSSTR
jgi:hypothetical protein